MTQGELIKALAQKAEITQKDAGLFLQAFISVVIESVASGADVAISDFGKFKLQSRAERQGRNPQSGESLVIPATQVPKFEPAKRFKEAVKQ